MPEFRRMTKRPLIINCGRGGLVDEAEPPKPENPLLKVMGRPNVIVTPHVAWASAEAVEAVWRRLIGHIENFHAGLPQQRDRLRCARRRADDDGKSCARKLGQRAAFCVTPAFASPQGRTRGDSDRCPIRWLLWNEVLIMPPHILSTHSLYDGWTTLRLVQLRLESGEIIQREVEDHGNAAAVLPFDPIRRTAILIRGLRVPALLGGGRTEILECPAGLIEESDPAQTARREAYEEVGLQLRDLEHVGRVWTSPGISTEMIDLYLAPYSAADRVHTGGGLASENEQLEVIELSLDRLSSMMEQGEIDDLKTLTLLLTLKVRKPQLFAASDSR
jgi:nudix-type nucleoside diphosphatase (YffH/AdpP family)